MKLSLRRAGFWGLGVAIGALLFGVALLVLSVTGCSLLGANAKGPTRFEEGLFTLTNMPMVTVHWMTNVVPVTNVVTQTVLQTNTVTVTNLQNQVEVQHVTVTNMVQVEQVVQQTNAIAPGTLVQVPQFTGRTGTGDAIVATGGAVGGLWGFGAIAVAVLSGAANYWQRARNAALVTSYTGASESANVAKQAGAALVQQIETLVEVLKTTPQGQAIAPTVVQFLQSHQVETGTLATVAQLVTDHVDNEAAREAAQDILATVNKLRGLGLPQGNGPAAAVVQPKAAV